MARSSLPPGFRFHPTDVELVAYYLKKKVMGKRFPFETISEIDLYKYAPWELPEKACLRSNDLEWYFFCPRDKKYPKGSRANRTTVTGFWKTSGKDRPIYHKSSTIGMKKTLIFHAGKPPKGERTDWVMYEYRLEDKKLLDTVFSVEALVLCKIFKKSGLGPKLGEQYGAPFNEDDWGDDAIEPNMCSQLLDSHSVEPSVYFSSEPVAKQTLVPADSFFSASLDTLSQQTADHADLFPSATPQPVCKQVTISGISDGLGAMSQISPIPVEVPSSEFVLPDGFDFSDLQWEQLASYGSESNPENSSTVEVVCLGLSEVAALPFDSAQQTDDYSNVISHHASDDTVQIMVSELCGEEYLELNDIFQSGDSCINWTTTGLEDSQLDPTASFQTSSPENFAQGSFSDLLDIEHFLLDPTLSSFPNVT